MHSEMLPGTGGTDLLNHKFISAKRYRAQQEQTKGKTHCGENEPKKTKKTPTSYCRRATLPCFKVYRAAQDNLKEKKSVRNQLSFESLGNPEDLWAIRIGAQQTYRVDLAWHTKPTCPQNFYERIRLKPLGQKNIY